MIFVALGANLPDRLGHSPKDTLKQTLNLFERAGIAVTARSPWYRSPPFPPSEQPDYVNGVIRVETSFNPLELLNYCHSLEHKAGRVRREENAARPLDLDLIDFDGLVHGTSPVLPHPRLHERAFVLLPLADIAPNWRHPVSLREVSALIGALPDGHGAQRIA